MVGGVAEWHSIAVQRATRGSPPNHSVYPMIPRGVNTDTIPAGPGPSTAPFFVLNMDLPENFDGASTNTRARHANTARPLLSTHTWDPAALIFSRVVGAFWFLHPTNRIQPFGEAPF